MLNRKLKIKGILPTMYNTRTIHASEVLETLKRYFKGMVFNTVIKETVKFKESSVSGSTILEYAKNSDYWLQIVKAALGLSKKYNGGFAGSWVLNKVKESGIKWFPGLRKLSSCGILERTDTSRGGRRAYYIMPDPGGVEEALRELGYLK